jgi:hypothetical protein
MDHIFSRKFRIYFSGGKKSEKKTSKKALEETLEDPQRNPVKKFQRIFNV